MQVKQRFTLPVTQLAVILNRNLKEPQGQQAREDLGEMLGCDVHEAISCIWV